MPNVWNIGNTTVRNPKRIENALRVFVEEGFSGNAKGSEVESKLHAKLKENEVLDFDGAPSDWNGRKWRAAFYQLGFISYEAYKINGAKLTTEELFGRIGDRTTNTPYQITPAGKKLIAATSVPEIEEIYTRQFACYELPNSLESGFPEGKLKPFILFLHVLKLLHDGGYEGLTKLETGLFLQKFRNHTNTLAQEILAEVLEFRDRIRLCSNVREVKAVRQEYLLALGEFAGIDPSSVVRDYSDTTFRYFSLSGLFTRIGDTIIVRSNKHEFVNRLLAEEPNFLFESNPIDYFKKFYKNTYPLPTDDPAVAMNEVEVLRAGIRDTRSELFRRASSLNNQSDLSLIQQIRYELIEYHNWEREEDFANEQQSEAAIRDILQYLKVLNGDQVQNPPEIDDRPAFLEWAVWRSFLAIDEITSAIHTTRRFPVDHDFMPRNTAPGGGSDLIFEFDSYVLVVEVTLTTSHRQMAAESEPVRRHTVQYQQTFPGKDVYCLFVAPSVDNNVAESYRTGVWYDGDDEEVFNIVPMTLSNFINAIETLLDKRFKNVDFKNLLDRCLVFRNFRAPQWKTSISKEVTAWKRRMLA